MATSDGMRLRCKVYTNPHNGRRHIVGGGFISDDRRRMMMFALSDEGFIQIELSVEEYEALPFFVFVEEGPAPPRPTIPVPLPWLRQRGQG